MEDHSRAGWSPWLLDRTVFIYFADGNGIPWASGAKKRTDGTRPAGENGTEYAQLVLKRAASRTDEVVEQLREKGLQTCRRCYVDRPISLIELEPYLLTLGAGRSRPGPTAKHPGAV